ncbi:MULTISPECIES: acyltransferase [Acinetobacter]|uniref:acyltransferase n=1 Tax=Acinetobacter TaxID=469 RepID=UPI000CEC64B9|nr:MULTISPECIES: acyltransferase [Acinetobacter]MCO8099209.1 acyltransferase [Acinetobacter indicus]MCO8104864.1 acyltransferase [Acinetobacter indicus]MCO8107904.1 acyltransferase [Acinetobacter indicus]MCO8110538.1 acyltransferase [Acinetobacter indicus]MDM1280631.1 acyltransferase [Acinetobacter indicus]
MTEHDPLLKYREQHKHRLNYMPWLYWSLKPKNRVWAEAWQKDYQAYLMEMETVEIGENCFISPLAHIFAEPGRKISIGDNTFIAADCTLHGPLHIGSEVAINHHSILDGGRVGIKIHDQVRIAAYCHLYAFDHGMDLAQPIYQQPVRSQGIEIERDVWLGAHVGVKDGIKIGAHAVVGMHSMVTKDIESRAIVAGNPARLIRYRD